MNKNKFFTVIGVILLLNLPVLAEEHHNHNANKPAKKTSEKKVSIEAVLSPKMASYPKMKPVNLSVKLSKQNKALEKCEVSMDLTMPGMYMPKNEVKLKEVSSGVYEGSAMFTMSGDWRLNTSVIKDKKKEMLYFDIKVD